VSVRGAPEKLSPTSAGKGGGGGGAKSPHPLGAGGGGGGGGKNTAQRFCCRMDTWGERGVTKYLASAAGFFREKRNRGRADCDNTLVDGKGGLS